MPARHFTISGHVQGVFFRAQTKEHADAIGLVGWVRNCEDGSVEVHAEGSSELLAALEEWLHVGPPAAEIHDVASKQTELENLKSFEIRY